MRLLRTNICHEDRDALVIEEFSGDQIPIYAILSHTWEDEEVLLADIKAGTARQKKGFKKIRFAADQARRDGFRYVWIDTCCIDKSSSAELSEAINSMYAWYQRAAICYTYLVDVPADVDTAAEDSEFTRSKWFTRGWCLQELLAPKDLVFFSVDWIPIGQKWTLHELISRITKIDPDILTGAQSLDSVSVAKRMSWAAARRTTRPEDAAYCLMGIFSVNMPMLYGEGSRAFHRLQEEIMKHSDDQSLFAWVELDSDNDSLHGLLADSPASFAHSANIIQYQDWEHSTPFDMSNRGLHIELPLTRCDELIYAAALNCPVPDGGYSGFLAIYLQKLPGGTNQYARVKTSKLGSMDARGQRTSVYVRQQVQALDILHAVYPTHFFHLQDNPGVNDTYTIHDVRSLPLSRQKGQKSPVHPFPVSNWLPRETQDTFQIPKKARTLAAAITFRRTQDGESFILLLGCTSDFDVGFAVLDLGPVDQMVKPDWSDLQMYFDPLPAGSPMVLVYHRVRVDVRPRVIDGSKYYLVDMSIESIPKDGPIAAVIEAAEVLVSPDPIRNRRKIWQKLGLA